MNAPDPKANTTTEAYLAYKAGYLEESELKPKLYEPYLHFDAWLAYWAGLVPIYPIKAPAKNLFNRNDISIGGNWNGTIQSICYPYNLKQATRAVCLMPVKPNTEYTVSLASSDWYVMEIIDVDSNFTILSKSKTTQENAFTQTITTGEHFAFLGFKFKYGSAGTATITKEMLSELKLQAELGDTATSYEDYTGEPEMLTDEEALVAYLSGVTDTYPEEIKDPYDVRIVGYLRHLASIRWPEPDYPVNNKEFYLSTMEPTHASNSEPSADIELDTADGKIISVEAYGDTKQQTYSGKNLINANGDFNYGSTNHRTTVNGDGTITVTSKIGTARSSGQKIEGLSPNTTYTLSAVALSYEGDLSTGDDGAQMEIVDSSSGSNVRIADTYFGTIGSLPTKGVLTFTTPENVSAIWASFNGRTTIPSAQAPYPTVVIGDLQLELGSTDTAFEPYVGGVPAPNPDYPQDVNVVTGEQTVKMTGKNLFDWAGLEQNSGDYANATLTEWNTNGVTITGNASTGVEFASSRGIFRPAASNTNSAFRVYLPDNATVTISADITLLENNYTPKTRIILDPGGVVGSSTTLTLNESIRVSQTFNNVAEGVYRPVFSLNSNKLKIENIQLEISSTASPFQPYQSQSYTISLGSTELCKIGDYQDYIYKNGDDWYLHKEIGKVVYDGTENWTFGTAPALRVLVDIETNMEPYTTNALCSHLVYGDTASASQNNVFNIGGSKVFAKATAITTSASSWKTWLGTHNVSLYYQLSTITETQITDSTLIGQLDALAGADTYDEKTYIRVTATDPNLPALLKVEAYKY